MIRGQDQKFCVSNLLHTNASTLAGIIAARPVYPMHRLVPRLREAISLVGSAASRAHCETRSHFLTEHVKNDGIDAVLEKQQRNEREGRDGELGRSQPLERLEFVQKSKQRQRQGADPKRDHDRHHHFHSLCVLLQLPGVYLLLAARVARPLDDPFSLLSQGDANAEVSERRDEEREEYDADEADDRDAPVLRRPHWDADSDPVADGLDAHDGRYRKCDKQVVDEPYHGDDELHFEVGQFCGERMRDVHVTVYGDGGERYHGDVQEEVLERTDEATCEIPERPVHEVLQSGQRHRQAQAAQVRHGQVGDEVVTRGTQGLVGEDRDDDDDVAPDPKDEDEREDAQLSYLDVLKEFNVVSVHRELWWVRRIVTTHRRRESTPHPALKVFYLKKGQIYYQGAVHYLQQHR